LGLEIAPKVRFMKKGQKQEQTIDTDTQLSHEKEEIIDNADEEEKDVDDDWFTVKKKSDALEEATFDIPEPFDKEKKLTKAKLAKKLRKKNLLINKRIEYDDDGNVSLIIIIVLINQIIVSIQAIVHSDEDDQSAIYNIEEAKARLHQKDKTDKEAYRALVKQKHKVWIADRIDSSISYF
jgi:hypothetical protein